MPNAESQRLADGGAPERMHEYALWSVFESVFFASFLTKSLRSSATAGVGFHGPDLRCAERYWTEILTSSRATTINKATAYSHLNECTGILDGAASLSSNACVQGIWYKTKVEEKDKNLSVSVCFDFHLQARTIFLGGT